MRRKPGKPLNTEITHADVEIIRCLNCDARSSVSKIAEELAMPESTVRHRLNRMINKGVIEFTAVPNPLHLGYQIWAIIEIQAKLSAVRSIARKLATSPEVYFVSITTGNYDILVGAVFRSNAELLEFMTDELPHIAGIERTRTATVLDVVKRFLTFEAPSLAGGTKRGAHPKPHTRRSDQSRLSREKLKR